MDLSKMKKEIAAKTESNELGKIKELSKNMENNVEKKSQHTLESADEALEKRIDNAKNNDKPENTTEKNYDENKLNKKGEVSFGAAGCEGFCKKVHDGTRVHGTY